MDAGRGSLTDRQTIEACLGDQGLKGRLARMLHDDLAREGRGEPRRLPSWFSGDLCGLLYADDLPDYLCSYTFRAAGSPLPEFAAPEGKEWYVRLVAGRMGTAFTPLSYVVEFAGADGVESIGKIHFYEPDAPSMSREYRVTPAGAIPVIDSYRLRG